MRTMRISRRCVSFNRRLLLFFYYFFFHDHAILILDIVIRVVTYAAVSLILNKYTCRSLVEGQEIETI